MNFKNLFIIVGFSVCLLLASCRQTADSAPVPTAVPTTPPIIEPATPTTEPTATEVVVTQPPAPATPTPPAATDTFTQQVIQAFTAGDYDWISAHMGSGFTIAGWLAGGSELPPAAAVDQLRTVYFVSGSQPAFHPEADTTALLGGVDPLSIWGPDTAVTEALYATGLGSQAQDEALLILAEYEDGSPYIYGMLSAFGGFAAYPQGG